MLDGAVVGLCVEVGGLVGVEMEALLVVAGEGVPVPARSTHSWMKPSMFIRVQRFWLQVVGLEARAPSSFGVRRSMTVAVKTLAGSTAAGIKGAGNLIIKSMKYRTGPGTFEGSGSEKLKLKALAREFQLLESFMGLTGALEVWRQHEAAVSSRMTTKATEYMLYQLREISSNLGPG